MSKPTPPPLAVEAIPPKTQASEPESMSREEIAAARQRGRKSIVYGKH